MESTENLNDSISKLQAVFRGSRSRAIHGRRARSRESIVCPYYASSEAVAKCMIEIGTITSNDLVVDLGSGAGHLLIPICQLTRATCVGYEIDAVLCATASRKSSWLRDCASIDIVQDDIINANLTTASVVCMFLVPSCCKVLSKKVRDECRKGTRIICK